jgi:dTDP-4-dehydrorhamnose reductase
MTRLTLPAAARVPYTEDDRPNPLSIYGKSKLAGERALIETNPRYFIVRTAWVYHTTGKNFPLTILSFSKKNEVRVVNDQIGSPTYAPHLAAAVGKLIEKKSDYGLYHIAGSGQASWFDVASHLYRKMGITTPVVPVSTVEFPRPALRPAFGVLASNRPGAVFMPPWEQGLDDFVKGVEKL